MSETHPSPQLQEALDLLRQDPLPADAGDRLERLEDAAPRSEREAFADLWEALTVARPMPPAPED